MTQPAATQIPFGLHPELVLGRYCAMTGAIRAALSGSDKTREVTMLRHEAMWLMRQLTSASQESIGRHFGDRDVATVHAGIARVADRIGNDPDYRKRMRDLVEDIGRGDDGAEPLAFPTKGIEPSLAVIAARGVLQDRSLSDEVARAAALQLLGVRLGA